MAKKHVILVLSALAFWGAYKVAIMLTPPPIPELDENAYWGPGKPKADDTTIKPFKINVPDQVIQDLNNRLDNTRDLTPPLEGIQFEYGFNTNTLKKILSFWRNEYNWREREQFLNQYPQFKTQIRGLDIHFIHIKPKIINGAKKTVPLLLMHGWPGSIREFYSLIPLLFSTSREGVDFNFELVVPSLPGYGFSQGASRPGLGAVEIGVVFRDLMKRLGHETFYMQGGDWGSFIGSSMATLFPGTVLGFHSNMCGENSGASFAKLAIGSVFPSIVAPDEYQHRLYPLSSLFSFLLEEFGYSHIQATKPDTIGVALTDSPAGLAAYILEKFSTWTNRNWRYEVDGGLTEKYSYTDLLDNIMIYWITGTATTSMRLYSETINARTSNMKLTSIPTSVPIACARFPNELIYQPDSLLVHKYKNFIRSKDFADGGHFAAFEVPKLLADDVWSTIIQIEANSNIKMKK